MLKLRESSYKFQVFLKIFKDYFISPVILKIFYVFRIMFTLKLSII